ncbi:MAG: ATP-binding protein [Magnetococcus sp. YQC-9]
MKSSESIISLLGEDSSIQPLNSALRLLILSGIIESKIIESDSLDRDYTLDKLRQLTNLPLIVRAFILYNSHSKLFGDIIYQFVNIFPTVSEIFIRMTPLPNNKRLSFFPVLKENNNYVSGGSISSGMLRVFSILLELALAPKGAVILIDEIENSLGVNCLPQIVDAMLARCDEVQFIITSHHPYVINNIPYEYWRLVRRQGGEVWLQDAKDIPALKNLASYQDRFLQLINTPEFEESMG